MPQGGSFPGRTTDGERLRERIISYLGNLPNVFSKRTKQPFSPLNIAQLLAHGQPMNKVFSRQSPRQILHIAYRGPFRFSV